jgi:DNA invertase Pin-like site-specific DNA recombinase
MVAEPGPNFRWGVVLRKSKLKRTLNQHGEIELVAESMDHQELEVVSYIRDNNMGIIVETYRDIASGWSPTAKRPRYKHALADLSSGWIDGIAVLAVDRLTRRTNQVRPILNALEEMGGRLFALWDELDTADNDPEKNNELRLHELVERAEREARRTSKRYKMLAQHRARKGLHHPGNMRPYGHTKDWRHLVDPEAEMVFAAAKAVDQGKTVWAIAEEWTRRGVPTVGGKTAGTLRCSGGFSFLPAWWASGNTRGLSLALIMLPPSSLKNSGEGLERSCWRIPLRGPRSTTLPGRT